MIQTIITVAGVISACVTIIALAWRGIKWFLRQENQDGEIKGLREKHEADQKDTQKELEIITYGVLACLRGLKEKGCNGPVTDAIKAIEKHLNEKAHKS